MNAVTNLVAIVSLLLALATAGDAKKDQAAVSSPSSARTPASRPLPPGGDCDEFGCGGNHNETLVRDVTPMK